MFHDYVIWLQPRRAFRILTLTWDLFDVQWTSKCPYALLRLKLKGTCVSSYRVCQSRALVPSRTHLDLPAWLARKHSAFCPRPCTCTLYSITAPALGTGVTAVHIHDLIRWTLRFQAFHPALQTWEELSRLGIASEFILNLGRTGSERALARIVNFARVNWLGIPVMNCKSAVDRK